MYIGLDLGTQSVKAVLLDDAGQTIRAARQSYPVLHPKPGHAEQSPLAWWQAVVTVLQAVIGADGDAIKGVGLAGQMHTTVLLDDDGQLLLPAILWMDTRSRPLLNLYEVLPTHFHIRKNLFSTGTTAATLLWLQHHRPTIMDQTAHVLLPKDYIRYRLTGLIGSDPTDASGTLLYDLDKHEWSEVLLEDVAPDLSPEALPPLSLSHANAGRITLDLMPMLGLRRDVPVAVGAADQAAMLLGVGAIQPRHGVLTIGTGGQLSVVTPDTTPHPLLNTFQHVRHAYKMGATLAAGYALSWWQQITAQSLDTLLAEAAGVPAGAEGAIFLPTLNATRHNAGQTGGFVGLAGHHTRAHLTRAVLEGVAREIRDYYRVLSSTGIAPLHLQAGGGGMRGLWAEIFASMLNLPLHLLAEAEPTARGAAMLAAIATGHFDTYADAVAAWVKPAAAQIDPNPRWATVYVSDGSSIARNQLDNDLE